jgi:hypothetical protein
MDILENGADRPPMRRRTRIVLLMAVAVAVLVAIALTGRTRSQHPAASPLLPSVPTPVVAALVDTGGASVYRSVQDTKEFVLSVDLINFNRVPAQVAGGEVPKQPAFDRLAVAVLPVVPGDEATIKSVAAATPRAVTIAARGTVQLVVAGRVVCAATPTAGDDFTILVNGEPKTVELPRFGGDSWVTEIIKELCPAK